MFFADQIGSNGIGAIFFSSDWDVVSWRFFFGILKLYLSIVRLLTVIIFIWELIMTHVKFSAIVVVVGEVDRDKTFLFGEVAIVCHRVLGQVVGSLFSLAEKDKVLGDLNSVIDGLSDWFFREQENEKLTFGAGWLFEVGFGYVEVEAL